MTASWRLMVRILVILAAAAGMAIAGTDETDSSQEYSRQPSLDALKRAYLAVEKGDHEEAYAHFQTALDEASNSSLRFQAHVGLGSAAAALRRLDEGREH